MVESPPASKPGANYSHIEHIQIRRHGGHIGVPNNETAAIFVFQRKPVGVGLFSCVKNFFQSLNFHDAGHMSDYALKTHWLSQPGELGQGETFRACASVVGSGKNVYFSPTGDSLHYFFTLLLISIRVNPKKASTYAQIEFTS